MFFEKSSRGSLDQELSIRQLATVFCCGESSLLDMELLDNLPHGPIIYLPPIDESQYYAKEHYGAKYQTCVIHILGIDGLVWGKHHEHDEYDRISYCSNVDG